MATDPAQPPASVPARDHPPRTAAPSDASASGQNRAAEPSPAVDRERRWREQYRVHQPDNGGRCITCGMSHPCPARWEAAECLVAAGIEAPA